MCVFHPQWFRLGDLSGLIGGPYRRARRFVGVMDGLGFKRGDVGWTPHFLLKPRRLRVILVRPLGRLIVLSSWTCCIAVHCAGSSFPLFSCHTRYY